MDKILAPIKQRILQYVENKGFEKIKFFEGLKVSASNFRGSSLKSEAGGDVIAKVLSSDESLSSDWLLTGKGQMFKAASSEIQGNNTILQSDKIVNRQTIPLYSIENVGVEKLLDITAIKNPIDYIQIPRLPKCDGAIEINGDGMHPVLKSGDIILYKQINNFEDEIFWGEIYLLSINQNRDFKLTINYVQKSDKGDNYIKLVSQNSYHQDRDVELKNVRALALIKASIRINSMY